MDTLTQIGTSIGVLAAAIYAAWHAARANKQTKGTGNGFAKDVKQSLARIEKEIEENHRLLDDHIADHAKAHLLRGRRKD